MPTEPDPLIPDRVEYMNPRPGDSARPGGPPSPPSSYGYEDEALPTGAGPFGRVRTVVVRREEMPCCSGCGCFLVLLAALLLLPGPGGLLGTLILAFASAWLASVLVRIAGVSRLSPGYVYALVPVFLIAMDLMTYLARGYYAFSALQIAFVTLGVYALLLVARPLSRR